MKLPILSFAAVIVANSVSPSWAGTAKGSSSPLMWAVTTRAPAICGFVANAGDLARVHYTLAYRKKDPRGLRWGEPSLLRTYGGYSDEESAYAALMKSNEEAQDTLEPVLSLNALEELGLEERSVVSVLGGRYYDPRSWERFFSTHDEDLPEEITVARSDSVAGVIDANSKEFRDAADRGTRSETAVSRSGDYDEDWDGEVIRGLAEGVVGMCPGDTRLLSIPAHLAFGHHDSGGGVPAGARILANVTVVSLRAGPDKSLTPAERLARRKRDFLAWQEERRKFVLLLSDKEKSESDIAAAPLISGFEPHRLRAGVETSVKIIARSIRPHDRFLLSRRGVTCPDAAENGAQIYTLGTTREIRVTLPRGIYNVCFQNARAVPNGWNHIWERFPSAIVKAY